MNLNYQSLFPEHFSPQSKVWVYQSSRLFSIAEALEIESKVQAFCTDWQSHGAQVEAFGQLVFGRFVVLMADETKAGVSGCSTDASVRFIKDLGAQYGVDFFNRTHLAFLIKDAVQVIPLTQFKPAVEAALITPETIFFDNTITTRQEFFKRWLLPVKESWLRSRLPVGKQA